MIVATEPDDVKRKRKTRSRHPITQRPVAGITGGPMIGDAKEGGRVYGW